MNKRLKIKGASVVLTLFLLLLIGAFKAVAAIDYTYTLDESLVGFDTVPSPSGMEFIKISGDKFWIDGKPGQPEIPYTVIRFLVPENAYDFTVSVRTTSGIDSIHPTLKIFPVQEDISINDCTPDTFTEPDEDSYLSYKSGFSAEVLEVSRLEGKYHVVTIKIRPFSFEGNSNTLRKCSNMGIRLNYSENNLLKSQSQSEPESGYIDISNIVVNPPVMTKGIQNAKDNPLNSDSAYKYFIISESSLLPFLEDLATWKAQKGYQVTMTAVEDIYEDSRYAVNPINGIVDEAASLRRYLQDQNDKQSTIFCLLVGDHKTQVPIRKVRDTESSTSNPYGDDYLPTDNYFSDLSEDNWKPIWDENGLYICLTDSTAFSPDIYVGRLLCHTGKEIENYISKLLLYETNPGRGNADYLNNAAITVQYDGKYVYKEVLNKMKSTFTSVDCLLDCAIADYNSFGSPTGKEMLNVLNYNGYCSLMGHGEPGTIACSGIHENTSIWEYVKAMDSYYYNENNPENRQTNVDHECYDCGLDLMTNVDSPSIIYSLACTTCPFDIFKSDYLTFDLPHTMASSFTVGGRYGGVAYLGNTRDGYWAYSSSLEAKFLENIKQTPKIGAAEALSKYQYTMDSHIRHTHNLIGDPEFEMWLGQPSDLGIDVSWQSGGVFLHGSERFNGNVITSDGEGNIISRSIKSSVDSNKFSYYATIPYSEDKDKMSSVIIFRKGYLPIVKLGCLDVRLSDCYKKFIVRDAMLGSIEDGSTEVVIGDGAHVNIRAIDKVECMKSLVVDDGGLLEIMSDKDVIIQGSTIDAGGEIKVRGENVTLSKGFSMTLGSCLSINIIEDYEDNKK